MSGNFVNFFVLVLILGIISLLTLNPAQAQEKPADAKQGAPKKVEAKQDADKKDEHTAPATPTDPRFVRLSKLVGKWKGTASHGEGKDETVVTYKLVGSGTSLVETLFEGTPHEMITVYHMDGSDLVMTHYCAAGNQPHCKAVKSDDPKSLKFEFAGGANIKPETDMHMHSLVMTWESDDKIKAVWTSWAGGKPAGDAVFELQRAK